MLYITVPKVENSARNVTDLALCVLVEFGRPLTKVIPVILTDNTIMDARAGPVSVRGVRHYVVTIAGDTSFV